MAKPLLDPPCIGWQEDLPSSDEQPDIEPSPGLDTPNHMDGIDVDISRRSSAVRGVLIWLSLIAATSAAVSLYMLVWGWDGSDKILFLGVGPTAVLVEMWLAIWVLKSDISLPRDSPIRFNRARQRIYAYNFRYRWWNPFERWYVKPVAYDWAQVRAERWKRRGVTPQGVVIFQSGVVLSIVAPGTHKVIDRFPLCTMGADEHVWAYVCTYMQKGPDALPPPGPPRDHNAVPWYNLALRLAPKVKWPPEMDQESRTAP